MEKIRFVAIILTICFFYSGCTKDNPIILKEVEDVCVLMDDIKFMQYCYSEFDVNSDGKVSMIEAAAVRKIDVSGKSIMSFKGIEYFTNLTSFNCTGCKLVELDVKNMVKLEELYCAANELTNLNVSKNVNLKYLNCHSCGFTTLDVSKNVELIDLYCPYNNLTTLDVSKNVKLTELSCNDNNLTALDVSKNVKLTELECDFNNLTILDVSKNVELDYLNCDHNPLEILYLNNKHKGKLGMRIPDNAKIEYR